MAQNKEIRQFLIEIGTIAGFKCPNKQEAHSKGICVKCGEPAKDRLKTEAGHREYGLSGMCEVCWDDIFSEPEDDENG
jgi:radical SAM superfamily enzyme